MRQRLRERHEHPELTSRPIADELVGVDFGGQQRIER